MAINCFAITKTSDELGTTGLAHRDLVQSSTASAAWCANNECDTYGDTQPVPWANAKTVEVTTLGNLSQNGLKMLAIHGCHTHPTPLNISRLLLEASK